MAEAPTGQIVAPDGDEAQSIMEMLMDPDNLAAAAKSVGEVIPAKGEAERATPKAARAEAPTDGVTEETADGEAPEGEEAPAADTASRLVLRLARSDRELAESRARVRDLERRVAEAESRGQTTEGPDLRAGDRLESVRRAVAHRLGVATDDPRVTAELRELVSDLVYEDVDEKALQGKELEDIKSQREARRKARQDAEWRRQLEERVNASEREKLQMQQSAVRNQGISEVGAILTRDAGKYPYLMAQDEVGAAEIVDAMMHAVQTGQVQVRNQAEGEAVVARIAANMNEHYRVLAGRLAPLAAPKAAPKAGAQPAAKAEAKKGPQAKRPGGRPAVGGAGGGGRGVPSAESQAGQDDTDEDDGDMRDTTDVINWMVRQSRGKMRI